MSIVCLGMSLELTHLEMVGWDGIYRPQNKTSHWRKSVALCAHRTVRWGHWIVWCPCPVRLSIGLTPQVTVGAVAFYTGQSACHTGQSDGFSPPVPPGTSRWATVPWCTGQSDALSQTVRQWQHLSSFLGLCLILVDLFFIFIMSSFELLLSSMP
jgi:hypothetical protein